MRCFNPIEIGFMSLSDNSGRLDPSTYENDDDDDDDDDCDVDDDVDDVDDGPGNCVDGQLFHILPGSKWSKPDKAWYVCPERIAELGAPLSRRVGPLLFHLGSPLQYSHTVPWKYEK